ncbi:MAG: hypothetical protein P4M12_01605 [Gammaproteobacteria bacterium]|nr:hypothetical protein [Gammaproteobacteria bacterium]
MKINKYLSLFILLFSLAHIEITLAQTAPNEDYFNALKEIQQLPKNATAISECSLAEEKAIVRQLDPKEVDAIFIGKPQLHAAGFMSNNDDNIKIYKGYFSNSGKMEYLFLAEGGGSMSTDTILGVYQLSNGHLINLHFDNIVVKNILGGKDLSHFYIWMPKPFAYVQNNKTYLRYMNYPAQKYSYDKTKLLVCTYLWEGRNFKLVDPKNCIGH